MKKALYLLFAIVFIVASCEWLEENAPQLNEEEIVEGLKTALTVGTDSSSTALSIANGYYGDALIKIPLPEEAIKVKDQVNTILAAAPSLSTYLKLDNHFENVVKSLNRAAEDAANDAAPVFKDAITSLSIENGLDILNGRVPEDTKSTGFDSTAATVYLKGKTFTSLSDIYSPKIDKSLDKDLGLGFSANQAWNTLRTTYNNSVNSIKSNAIANFALNATGKSLDPLQTESIGVFATEKALDGLFLKVGETEKKIRRNPFQWAMDILHKVFG